MALKQGRQGFLGLGIESTPGTSVAATTTVPFVANTIKGKHEIQKDIAARASRAQNYTSVTGKQWGEGDVTVNIDTLNSGFLLKLATGTEIVNTISAPNVYDHIFYTTISGNTPLTATLYNYQGVDTQQFASMAVDKLTLEVKDSLMTGKVGFKGFFPTNGSYTATTVSGTLLNFNDYQIQLGSTLIAAGASSKISISDFMLSIDNNAEVIFESGQARASRVAWKELKVTGSFTRFFETTTDRDNYYNLNKQSLVVTCSGNALGTSSTESLTINLAKLAYTDSEVTTGLEDFYAIKTTFDAEVDVIQGKQYDIVLRNFRSTSYT
jgi:hypothetical protein